MFEQYILSLGLLNMWFHMTLCIISYFERELNELQPKETHANEQNTSKLKNTFINLLAKNWHTWTYDLLKLAT